MEFSRQEYWSGLPFPSPGDLPDPGTEPRSPALQVDSLPSEPPGRPNWQYVPLKEHLTCLVAFTIWATREAQFAVCTPKRASYLFGCLEIYIKAPQTAEGTSPWKSPWSTTTSQQARMPIQWCPKQERALYCTAPQGPLITDRHWAIT